MKHRLKNSKKESKKKGLLFLNTSLVHDPPTRTDITRIEIKANDIAEELGDIRISNMVMLGAFLKKSGVVALESVLSALKQVLPARRHSLIPLNENALSGEPKYIPDQLFPAWHNSVQRCLRQPV